MKKQAILRFVGNLDTRGFHVSLIVRSQSNGSVLSSVEKTGGLPTNAALSSLLKAHWEEKYRNLGSPSRKIEPVSIEWDVDPEQLIKECKQSQKELLDRFNQWLNSQEFQGIKEEIRDSLGREDSVQFQIRSNDGSLEKLPWEESDLIRRYSQSVVTFTPIDFGSPNRQPSPFGKQVKVLAILGHRQGINVEADRRFLENLPNVNPKFLVEPSRSQISEDLWNQPWDIIFFAGHSETENETGKIYINPQESLEISELWYGLRKAVDRGLKLAIFNSCDGLGLTRKIDELQIPQMVVMRERVPDRVAHEFLKHFLQSFSEGKPIELSVREARDRLQGLEGELPCASWLPVIYQGWDIVPPVWPKPQLKRGSIAQPIATSLLSAMLVIIVRFLGGLEYFELKALDYLMRLRPDEGPDPRLLIVEIDAESVREQFPTGGSKESINDENLEELLKKLEEAGSPKVMGLSVYRNTPIATNHQYLIDSFQENDRLVPLCKQAVPSLGSENVKASGFSPPAEILKRDDDGNVLPDRFKHLQSRVGFSDAVADGDKIIRRHLFRLPPDSTGDCPATLSLGLVVAMRYLKDRNIELSRTEQGWYYLGDIKLPGLENGGGGYSLFNSNYDGNNQILINYRSLPSLGDIAERVTLSEVLSGSGLPNNLSDRIVLIGPHFSIFALIVWNSGLQLLGVSLWISTSAIGFNENFLR